jgi:gluconokinase
VILNWLREQLAIESTHAALIALAQKAPVGAGGLIFHPYLLGERSPLWRSDARGSFFGLTINHGKPHLVRAVLEGIAFNLNLILQTVQELTEPIHTVKAAGGLTSSSLWRQILADVLNQEILFPQERESSSLGAAILALYALNRIDSLHVDFAGMGEADRYQPLAANVSIYQQIMAIYQRLLPSFQAEYGAIAHLQNELTGSAPNVLGD